MTKTIKKERFISVCGFWGLRVHPGEVVWHQKVDRETGAEAESSHLDLQAGFSVSPRDGMSFLIHKAFLRVHNYFQRPNLLTLPNRTTCQGVSDQMPETMVAISFQSPHPWTWTCGGLPSLKPMRVTKASRVRPRR